MLEKNILVILLAFTGIAAAQETTKPTTPRDSISQHYLNALDKARIDFHAAVAKLATLRDAKLEEMDKSSEQMKSRARQLYSDGVDVLARAYGVARKSALTTAGEGYDQQMREAMTRGKAELLATIKDQKNNFIEQVASGEQEAIRDAKSLRGPASAPPPAEIPIVAGPVIAEQIVTVTDDFIVDVYQNGQKLPDSVRSLISETFGATSERITIKVHRGDWIVFNVANDRLRWGGAYGFIAAGLTKSGAVAFVSSPASHLWSYCDDVEKVSRFISEPSFMQYNYALTPTHAWDNASMLNGMIPNSGAVTIWGKSRNTWVKFIADVP